MVVSNDFFHPYHIVPAVKFIAAVVEGSSQLEAQMRVELCTVFGKIFVLNPGITDAGIQVQNSHFFQSVSQGTVKNFSHYDPDR